MYRLYDVQSRLVIGARKHALLPCLKPLKTFIILDFFSKKLTAAAGTFSNNFRVLVETPTIMSRLRSI